MGNKKRSIEEREDEYITFVEQILGGTLMPWQRKLMLDIRRQSLSGRTLFIDINEARKRK